MAVVWKRATESAEPYELFSRRTTQIMFAAMAVTLLVSSIVFYVQAATPSLAQTSTAILIAIGLLIAAVRMPSLKDPLSAIGALSLLGAIGYSTTMVAGDAHLSTHRSTKNILAYAASLAPGQHLNIGFASNLPFSARFYSALMSDPTIKVTQINNEAIPQATEDLIITRTGKRKDGSIHPANPEPTPVASSTEGTSEAFDVVMQDPTKERIGELGRWRVYRRKQQ
jgi:hypothetical protein